VRSTDPMNESVWKRSLSSIAVAVSPGSGAPNSTNGRFEVKRRRKASPRRCGGRR
jgi:hypothetical protein